MCGFVGFIDENDQTYDHRAAIIAMADAIAHRGPDSEGYFNDGRTALGFRRLAIIDLAGANQPLYNENRSLVLVFNGEIYNYRELRRQLIAAGHAFSTQGDAEVVLHGFEQWGEGVLDRLRGMFAFALYDTATGELFCARDTFGIKPLYYAVEGGRILFGSEIKGLLAHPHARRSLNERRLAHWLCMEYLPDEETLFEGVRKLPAGHWLRWRNGRAERGRWFVPRFAPDAGRSLEESAEAIEAALRESVAAHAIADVDVGCFLSAGVDSSLVAREAARIMEARAFTIGWGEGRFSELEAAATFARATGLPNEGRILGAEQFFASVPAVQYAMDEPLPNPSAVPLYHLCAMAAESVKVVLSGEGADELFGGYWIYHDQFEFDKYFKVPRPLRAAAGAVAEKLPSFHGRRFAMRGSGGPEKSYQRASMNYMWDEIPNVLRDYDGPCKPWEWCKPHFDEAAKQDIDIITQTQYVDMVSYMPFDICLKADKMSMSQSLELRVPFLDKKVLDVALQLPTACRVDDSHAKYALRVAASKLGFQKKVANMPKQPFITPLTVWLQTDLYYDRIKEAFTSEAAHEFFNVDYLVQMLDDHKSADFSTVEGRGKLKMMRIWNIYCFLCWYEVFFGKSSEQLKPKTKVA